MTAINAQRVAKIERRIGKAVSGHDTFEVGLATSTFLANFVGTLGGDQLTQLKGVDALAADAKQIVAKRFSRDTGKAE